MQSAEQKLTAAWQHVDHGHASHTPVQVIGIERGMYNVKCSCGDFALVPLKDVLEHTDGPDAAPSPAGSSLK